MGKNTKRKRRLISESELDGYWDKCFSRTYPISALHGGMKETSDKYMNVNEVSAYLLHLYSEKVTLNEVKSRLNSIDIESWRKHTSLMHKCGFVVSYLRNQAKGELVTQAWAKFFTILNSFNIFPDLTPCPFMTVHLCEAPGAFVTSLNHYLKNKYKGTVKWDWIASTLNPYYECNDLGQMVNDDRFIIETLDHWDFGPDYSGNIMNKGNLAHLKEKFANNTTVRLVTADGSIDCTDDPGEQENIVSLLFLWETVTALSILSENGSFVLKVFTLFEKFTISLLYLLWTVFDEVTLFKPGPSKPGNSEIYVVCQKFSKQYCLESSLFSTFIDAALKKDISLAVVDFVKVPEHFLSKVKGYVEMSCSIQRETIENHIETYEDLSVKKREEIKFVKHYIAERFLREYKITPPDEYISSALMMKTKYGSFYDKTASVSYKKGSYNERLSSKECFVDLKKDSEETISINVENESTSCYFSSLDCIALDSCTNFNIIVGKSFENVTSSSFCKANLLQNYYRAWKKCLTDTTDLNCSAWFRKVQSYFASFDIPEVNNIVLVCSLGEDEQHCFADIPVNHIEPSLTVTDQISTLNTLVVSNLQNANSKQCNILHILTSLKVSAENVVFKLDSLVLTNFWAGIFFVVARLFTKVCYFKSHECEQGSYMLFINYKNKESKSVLQYLERLYERTFVLVSHVDLLHVVPIYTLMHTKFRDYLTSRNEYFMNTYIQHVAAIYLAKMSLEKEK